MVLTRLKWHKAQVAPRGSDGGSGCACQFDLFNLRVRLLPRNLFPFTPAKHFRWLTPWGVQDNSLWKALGSCWEVPQICSPSGPTSGSWDPSLGPPGLTEVHTVLVESPKTVIENTGSAACLNQSQTREISSGTKGKWLIQVSWPGKIVDSHLKDYHPSCSSLGSYRDRERRVFFPSSYLASFWHNEFLSIHLSSFWHSWCKNLPLYHIGQWGRLPCAPCRQ